MRKHKPKQQKALEPISNIFKQDLFNLEDTAGLLAIRQALHLWLSQQPKGEQVTVVSIKPGSQKKVCRIQCRVGHSTQVQTWNFLVPAMLAHLNQLTPQTGWSVSELRLCAT